jgi:hypothetical protein
MISPDRKNNDLACVMQDPDTMGPSIPFDAPYDIAVAIPHFHDHRHLPHGMRRTGQAGVVAAYGGFHTVEHTLPDIIPVYVKPCHFGDRPVH